MLSNQYFYHKLLRKYVTLFGTMFDDITIVRRESDDSEIKRFTVPLIHSPKDTSFTRVSNDPDLYKETQITLPRMGFEIVGINYDPERQQNPLLKVAKNPSPTRVSSQFMGAPYNLNFELNIYTKTIDDANHIVEQILPYFQPDYTITLNPIPSMGFLKDIPVILDSVNQAISYEGPQGTVRLVNWTLAFTMKVYFFGPINTPKIIRKSIANIFNDPSLVTGYITRINTNIGNNGTFQISDTVYQGDSYNEATAFGTVLDWNLENRKLMLGAVQGQFKANNTIRALSSNASYSIASFDSTPLKLTEIVVEPDPIDAEANSNYGYTTTITEFPDTIT